jgi:hypothetical protein
MTFPIIPIAIGIVGAVTDEFGDVSIAGRQTQLGFGTQQFLDRGKESGVWFSVSAEARRVARESGPEAEQKLAAIEAQMNAVNAFLARTDVSDQKKLEFLKRFLGQTGLDYEDSDDGDKEQVAAHMGAIFAEVMAGDTEILEDIIFDDSDGFFEDALTFEDLNSTAVAFHDELTSWQKDNEVDLEPDKTLAWFSKGQLEAEERSRRRNGMTARELLADIERENEALRREVEKNKREHAQRA